MKVLFYQTWSASNRALFAATHPNHAAYCTRHGYSFVTDCCDYSPYLNVPKIRALLDFADLVVTIGSDCVFTDMARPIEEFMDAEDGVAVCAEGTQNSLCNGEILLVRNTPYGYAFLNGVDALQKEFPDCKWGFQSILNRMLNEKRTGVEYVQELIPAGTLQSYLSDEGRFQPYKWKSGDFMAHALGGDLQSKLARVRALQRRLSTVDVILPLSSESCSANDELRIALRSIERHVRNLGTVRIVTDCAPDWLRNVTIVPVGDIHRHNKDANLFNKLLTACAAPDMAENFIFMSDDQAFLTDFHAMGAPTVYNVRGPASFRASAPVKWDRRMHHTFEYLKGRGMELKVNFDAHVPVVYRTRDFVTALDGVDYAALPGFCINTLVCGLLKRKPEVEQMTVKAQGEGAAAEFAGKQFAGYDDAGFKAGMREKLFARFPEKSRFEK